MNILVTGGLGFIGHNVVAMLEAQGHKVGIIDNETDYGLIPKTELSRLIALRKQKIKTNSIYLCDIVDPDVKLAFSLLKPDIVIHLASFPRQKVVNQYPAKGSQVMSEGLLNLLENSAKFAIKKFVYISSSMVYGDFTDDQVFNGIKEDSVCNPMGQYAILKYAGELLVKDYARRTGISYTILRPSAVYGPLDVEDRVVSKFLASAMRGETLQVNGFEEELDFTYIDDCVKGIVDATLSTNTQNKIYNIAKGHSRTLLSAAQLIIDIVGDGKLQVTHRDDNFPRRGQLDISNAIKDFGFSPTTSIAEGFSQYYSWLKSQ